MSDLFLSHTGADKAFAHRLGERLRADGISVWIDEFEMQIGDSLVEKIGSAIKTSAFLAVVLSPESVQSTWVKREVEIALSEEFQNGSVKVLPIIYRSCEVPVFLRGKLYADFSHDFEVPYGKLLRRIRQKPAVHPRKFITEFVETFRLADSCEAKLRIYMTVETSLHDASKTLASLAKSAIVEALKSYFLTVEQREYYTNFSKIQAYEDQPKSIQQGLIEVAQVAIEDIGLIARKLIFVQEPDEITEGFKALLFKAWPISVIHPNSGARIGHFRVRGLFSEASWYDYANSRPSYSDVSARIEACLEAVFQLHSDALNELSSEQVLVTKTISKVGKEEFGLSIELLDWRRTPKAPLKLLSAQT